MSHSIQQSLEDLRQFIAQRPELCCFAPPAEEPLLRDLETLLSISLPRSYRAFLRQFNGGFICDDSLSRYLQEGEDRETARWNSLNIFGTAEIIDAYLELKNRKWKLSPDWKGVYPLLPVARTDNQDYLLFVLPLNARGESPVFDGFHEDFPNDWGLLYEDFAEFLSAYADFGGQPPVISDSDTPRAAEFLPASGWRIAAEESEDPRTVRAWADAALTFFPEDSWTLCRRGEAFTGMGEYEKALADLHHSAALDGENPYTFYCLARLHQQREELATALTYYDTAVKILPDDPFYLSVRAQFYLAVGEYRAAVADCSRAVELDPAYDLAYLVREQCYRKLGDSAKAAADGKIIEKLLSGEEPAD